MSIIEQKLAQLAKPESAEEFDKAVSKLMGFITDYNKKTGVLDPKKGHRTLADMYAASTQKMRASGGQQVAERADALIRTTVQSAQTATVGAKSTLYRVLQTMDLYKRIENGSFQARLKSLMTAAKVLADDAAIQRLVQISKEVMMDASITHHVEKLKAFNLSEKEYRVVMRALFSDKSSEVERSLIRTMGKDAARGIIGRFRESKDRILTDVGNWQNTITPDLARRTVTGVIANPDAENRNSVIGNTMKDTFKRICDKAYNSKKWMKMFGGVMIGLTAATLIAGLFIGRKGKIEKQAETEKRNNVLLY